MPKDVKGQTEELYAKEEEVKVHKEDVVPVKTNPGAIEMNDVMHDVQQEATYECLNWKNINSPL